MAQTLTTISMAIFMSRGFKERLAALNLSYKPPCCKILSLLPARVSVEADSLIQDVIAVLAMRARLLTNAASVATDTMGC